MRSYKFTDPDTGVVYPSMSDAARAYGVPVCTVYARLAKGYSPEVALHRGNIHHTPSKDHTGACFPTRAAMCRHWGISVDCFRQRFDICGWPLERALTEPVGQGHAKGHRVRGRHSAHPIVVEGVEYPSVRAAAEAYGVSVSAVYNRLNRHDPVDRAFRPARKIRLALWYKGRRYFTRMQLARELNLPVSKIDFLEGVTYE